MQNNEVAQLAFALNNKNAPNTIYKGTNSNSNDLELVITSNTNCDLSAAEPVNPNQAGQANGTLIYLDLAALGIDADQFAAIECEATNWAWQGYDESVLCFAPTVDMQLGAGVGDHISIKIKHLAIGDPSIASANLNVDSYRIDPIISGRLPVINTFKVLIMNPPDGHADLHDYLNCEITPFNFVTNSLSDLPPVENGFSVVFSPGDQSSQVLAGPDSRFIVSFIYANSGPGYGAMCTPQEGIDTELRQGLNAIDWRINANSDPINPSWTLVPPDGEPIVGSGAKSTVEFQLSKLVTYFEPGVTLVFVQYAGIPGYDDGAYALLVNKLPHVAVDELTVSPNPSVLQNGSTEVAVSWQTRHAEKLMLMPFYQDVTGQSNTTVTLNETTEITLIARGEGSVGNEAVKSVKATVLPVINSFTGTPTNIYAQDYPHQAQFYWDVDTQGQVYLENTAGMKELVGSRASARKTLYQPNMWTVAPRDAKDFFKLKRDLMVRSFDIENSEPSIDFATVAIDISPTAPFVAAISNNDHRVHILNNITYDDYTDPIATGNQPVDVVFSSDGNFMFVADQTDCNVAIYLISYNRDDAAYEFQNAQEIALQGAPQRILVSDDRQYVFISCIKDGAGEVVVLKTSDPDPYEVLDTLAVGNSPQGMAMNPSGAQVFVANQADNSLSVIGYSPISESFEVVKTIADVTGTPTDVAVVGPDNGQLAVCCESTNEVLIMDPNAGGDNQRRLSVGQRPNRLATMPGYVWITNSGGADVSLISIHEGWDQAKVVELDIGVINNASTISISADHSQVVVGSSQTSGLNVLNLINFTAKGTPVDMGDGVNSVAVSSDGHWVVAWHDVNALIPAPNPSKGLFIYNTTSATVDQKMDASDVVNMAFYPQDEYPAAFVTVKGEDFIHILDTEKFDQTAIISIPKGDNNEKRFPQNLTIADNGQYLATLTQDNRGNHDLLIFAIDMATGHQELVFDHTLFNNSTSANTLLLSIAAGAEYLAVVSAVDKQAWVIQQVDGQFSPNGGAIDLQLLAKSMVINPNNNKLYILSSLNTNNGFNVIDLEQAAGGFYPLPASYTNLLNLQKMVMAPDGKSLYITDAGIAGMRVVDSQSLRFVQTLEYSHDVRFPTGITVTPDGMNMYFVGTNTHNLLWVGQIGYNRANLDDADQSDLTAVALDDQPYAGIFIRDYLGQQPGEVSNNWTTSPDIICNGTSPLHDVSELTNQDNYNTGQPNTNTQTPLTFNYAYVRGINTAPGAQEATIYLYAVDTSVVLWPQNWDATTVMYDNVLGNNGIPVNATSTGEIVATFPGYLWKPARDNVHYCLAAWVVNGPNAKPPALYDIGTVNDMAQFITSHPNVGWRNTIRTAPFDGAYQDTAAIEGPPQGGILTIGVQLKNMPVDGIIDIFCQGPDPLNTIDVKGFKISSPNQTIAYQVEWPAGFNSTLVFKYYLDGTQPPDGANVIPIVGTSLGGRDFMAYVEKVCPQHIGEFDLYTVGEPIDHGSDSTQGRPAEKIFVVGSVAFGLEK